MQFYIMIDGETISRQTLPNHRFISSDWVNYFQSGYGSTYLREYDCRVATFITGA